MRFLACVALGAVSLSAFACGSGNAATESAEASDALEGQPVARYELDDSMPVGSSRMRVGSADEEHVDEMTGWCSGPFGDAAPPFACDGNSRSGWTWHVAFGRGGDRSMVLGPQSSREVVLSLSGVPSYPADCSVVIDELEPVRIEASYPNHGFQRVTGHFEGTLSNDTTNRGPHTIYGAFAADVPVSLD